jgi:acyl-coenzyme A synthetase/AMP-(fatty) acid ligase
MMPARWIRYDSLPKNGNGKIDRPRLRNAFLAATNAERGVGVAQGSG